MKRNLAYTAGAMLIMFFSSTPSNAQDVYGITSGELLFQSASVEHNGADMNTNLRFTLWFHLGEYIHLDVSKNIGFFTGLGIRNVGFITEENDIKTKYRSYTLGVPLALKLGSFRDHFYIYGGAEYEWMFHFKQKTFVDDQKIKYSDWFSNRTPDFIPSVFAGIQFPYGMNIKFKYYLDDFLNHDYQGTQDYSDYTGFEKTQVWYISVSFQIRNSEMKDMPRFTGGDMAKR